MPGEWGPVGENSAAPRGSCSRPWEECLRRLTEQQSRGRRKELLLRREMSQMGEDRWQDLRGGRLKENWIWGLSDRRIKVRTRCRILQMWQDRSSHSDLEMSWQRNLEVFPSAVPPHSFRPVRNYANLQAKIATLWEATSQNLKAERRLWKLLSSGCHHEDSWKRGIYALIIRTHEERSSECRIHGSWELAQRIRYSQEEELEFGSPGPT